ncbi:transmembrane protein 272-like isoform X1 [Gigantopelta aegis]|uniref:transmembrane protein 272-like isoform X1 n=1 Tax=Gigantopelta aegis TaxID=1735272 RepID=UPI001B88B7D5|nr:transmembrane protein 272-like isoform X1 [Gigantopelta aegis]
MSVRLARMESVRKLKTIEKESTGIICFIQRLAQCCQSVGTLVIIVSLCLVVIGIGIAKMVMGSLFFHACPAQPLIPIWLIVGAMVSFLYTSASQTSKVAGGEHNNDARYARVIFGVFVSLFTFLWLILGTVWIVQANQHMNTCSSQTLTTMASVEHSGGRNQTINVTSSTAPPSADCNSCDSRLFNFAFGILLTEWSLLVLMLIAGCLLCCSYCCLKIFVS